MDAPEGLPSPITPSSTTIPPTYESRAQSPPQGWRLYAPRAASSLFAEEYWRHVVCGAILVGAGAMHILSIALNLDIIRTLIAELTFSDPQSQTALLGLLYASVGSQLAFAGIAFGGAAQFLRAHRISSATLVTSGVSAVLLSFLLFGGVIGAVGGALSVAAGGVALSRHARPTMAYPAPPWLLPPR